jgi:hypothetical protein
VMGRRSNLIDFDSLALEVREGYARSEVMKLKAERSPGTNRRWIQR